MSCIEQNFGIIATISYFDLSSITLAQNMYIPKRVFSSDEAEMFPEGTKVPMHPKSANLSESAIQGRGGNGYEVSLSWQVKSSSADDISALELLKSNAKCLRITAFGGVTGYLLADDDHYQFDYQRNGEMIDCSLKVYSINGLQQVMY